MAADRSPKLEWNAEAYHRVARPQTAWGLKVLGALPPLRGDETILDVGCGSGRLTRELAERVPRGKVIALDRSSRMVEEARANLAAFGDRVTFIDGDALDLDLDCALDVVFSTATFHWIIDHPRLFRVLYRALVPGGLLLAQCGGGQNLARVHARAEPIMAEPTFAPYLQGFKKPVEYADAVTTRARLAAAGFDDIAVSLEAAPTAFANAAELAEFLSNVVFLPHLERLPDPALKKAFIEPLVAQAANDRPPFELDYWRLNLRARRRA